MKDLIKSQKQLMQSINSSFCTNESEILEWYDGPLFVKSKIEGKDFYYHILNISKGYFAAFHLKPGIDAIEGETLDPALSNVFLNELFHGNNAYEHLYLYDSVSGKNQALDSTNIKEFITPWKERVYERAIYQFLVKGVSEFYASIDNKSDSLPHSTKIDIDTSYDEVLVELVNIARFYGCSDTLPKTQQVCLMVKSGEQFNGCFNYRITQQKSVRFDFSIDNEVIKLNLNIIPAEDDD